MSDSNLHLNQNPDVAKFSPAKKLMLTDAEIEQAWLEVADGPTERPCALDAIDKDELREMIEESRR